MRRALLLVIALGCSETADPQAELNASFDQGAPLPIPDPVVPLFRYPVGTPDAQLALDALRILGANVPGRVTNSCNTCHSLTRQQLRYWRALSDTAMSSCLTDLDVESPESARTMIECLRAMPSVPQSDFLTKNLGIYASAVKLGWFDFTVRYGYGEADGKAREVLRQLSDQVGMPRGTVPALSQTDFDIVAEWFVRGLPRLEETLPQDPAPTVCVNSVSADVGAHVAAMQTQGWRARNTSSMMRMHGCGASTDPRQCLASMPFGSEQSYGGGWDLAGTGRTRVLADVPYRTSYWTRSSADGRFIAHGVASISGSYIIDLQRGGALITVNAAYDPTFFPDNSGFVFQGGPRNTCGLSVLTSNPTSVSMNEPECTSLGSIGLYQHVGAIAGGDHFAIDSRFVSDDGGHSATLRDPYASFNSSSQVGYIPLVFDGTTFSAKPQVTLASPFEGDIVISPSAKLAISRVAGPGDQQLGFVMRKVVATPSGNSYTIQLPEVARYCVNGGKPAFSYDERWLVYHHYITNTNADAIELGFTSTSDPGFQPYRTLGAANTYLMDLTTGVKRRITNMRPGQYALFPHFRSDGWIYIDVRDRNTTREYMIASEAALLLE
jgi:hypothetical protein